MSTRLCAYAIASYSSTASRCSPPSSSYCDCVRITGCDRTTRLIDYSSPSATAADGYLALYHDQGLIPVKLMAFDLAVNTTIGLPFIRTSPDHGTAFDIAGKGIARATSTVAAIELAVDLAAQRRQLA